MKDCAYGIKCFSPFRYEGRIRQSLLRFKFHGCTGNAAFYAAEIWKLLKAEGQKPDIISWVPLSRKRLRQRGYDQAGLIARELSALTGIPCRRVLNKISHNPPQSGTAGHEQREKNVKGVYALSRKSAALSDKKILLIDDIITTGSTLSECCRVMLQGGFEHICCATAASTLNL